MTSPLLFMASIVGKPAPQGSKRHVGKGVLVESSADVGPWRDAVALQVLTIMRRTEHPGFGQHVPVALTVTFALHRPPSLPRRVTRPARKPDLDKLLRSTLDALTDAGLLTDDGQVVMLSAHKRYAEPGAETGAVLVVRDVGDLE